MIMTFLQKDEFIVLDYGRQILKLQLFIIRSKPGYSNYFFAAKNGKKEPIVRKNR